jgi:hypothetical protein
MLLALAMLACTPVDDPGGLVDTAEPEDSAAPEDTSSEDTGEPDDTGGDGACEQLTYPDPLSRGATLPIDKPLPHLMDGVLVEDILLLAGQSVDHDGALWAFGVADADAPTLLGRTGFQQLMGICWADDHGWVSYKDGRIARATLGDPAPALEPPRPVGGTVMGIDCDGTRIAWGMGAEGAGYVDDTTDLGPFTAIAGDARDVVLEGDTLWTLGLNRLTAWDISAEPVALGGVDLLGSCHDLAAGPDFLAAACGSQGVALIDRNGTAPTVLGRWFGSGAVRAVAIDGDRVLLAAWTDLLAVDATDPANPTLIGAEPAATAVTAVVPGADGVAWAVDWKQPFGLTVPGGVAPEVRVPGPFTTPGALIHVANDGDAPLCLAEPSEGTLSTDIVAPGAAAVWTLPDTVAEETVTISTDDPDEPLVSLDVGGTDGLTVGDPAPDFLEVDLDGTSWQLSALEGRVIFLGLLDGT